MKHLSTITLCCGFSIFLSCSPKAEAIQGNIQTTKDSIVVNDETGHIALTIEHPTDTTSLLSKTIIEYLSETLGGTFSGNYSSPKNVMSFYHGNTYKDMKEDYESMKEIRNEDIKLEWDATLIKKAETEKYVTYTYQCEQYNGGAHGMHTLHGITIRKSDCRRIGWETVRDYQNEKMQEQLRKGLKGYFNVSTDEELKSMLFPEVSLYSLPQPQCPPLFTPEGIMFVYNSYEIAPYAAGKPMFTIPYDELKDFMTVTAQRLAE